MDEQATGALARWRGQLDGWAIPEEILARAPESPWGFPVGLFRARAQRAGARPPTPSTLEAARFLPPGGSVLDVGAGGGAASLPLAGTAGRLVAVDESLEMIGAFLAAAEAAGVPADGVHGAWPEVAGRVGPADVVVCHHVLYNVADLAPFVDALTGHARRRVVVELTERHPLVGLGQLWRRFHDLERPTGPTAGDAFAALRALGLDPARQDWETEEGLGFDRFDDLVAFTRRRLCLPADRDPEVAQALLEAGTRELNGTWVSGPPRRLTTLSWPGAAS
ncbi:MAG TPA: methyltransferase domain-containing protein [Actinomycetes bacterium]|jgi:SAM-dependent methyltransferase|nr:methyltransferase domain-containing protein [Actinomycetes bacterium]